MVVNNTGVTGPYDFGLLSRFPFNRLAVTNRTITDKLDLASTNGSGIVPDRYQNDYFLYHQLDEVNIAEEHYMDAGGVWKTMNITLGS